MPSAKNLIESTITETKFRPGDRVQVAGGSGLDSDKVGTVIDRSEVKTGGRGIPALPGHYKPVDWSREVAVKLDDGSVITMFKERLKPADKPDSFTQKFAGGKWQRATESASDISKTTVIDGYTVELDVYPDEPSSQCFVSKGNYSASLAALDGTGVLTDHAFDDKRVDPNTIAKIVAWAEANGY